MDKFNQLFNNIINETKFSNKKWKYDSDYDNVEIYFNLSHFNNRLKLRDPNTEFDIYKLFVYYIIDYLNDNNIFNSVEMKEKDVNQGLKRGFTFNGTISNVWISGVIQNDLNESKYRIYISTTLTSTNHTHSTRDLFIQLAI